MPAKGGWLLISREGDADASRIVVGAFIVVGGGLVRAVAQVVDITDEGVVNVRPLSGPLSDHVHLLRGRAAS
jgi:hypothetical protein